MTSKADTSGAPQHEHPSDVSDVEDPHRLDEENLGARFQDQDLELLLAEATQSEMVTESTAFLKKPGQRQKPSRAPKWMPRFPNRHNNLEDDDDVPESLLLEEGGIPSRPSRAPRSVPPPLIPEDLPPPVPGPANNTTRAQWRATRAQQRLHDEESPSAPLQGTPATPMRRDLMSDPQERALWKWTNVDDLDMFLRRAYEYFDGYGIWSILMRRVLNLAMTGFAVLFTVFLTSCVKWRQLGSSSRLSDVTVDRCSKNLPGFTNFLIWVFVASWLYNLSVTVAEIPRLWDMRNFYLYLLEIPDSDMQTISWQYIVSRIMALRDANPTTNLNLTPQNRRFLNGQSKQRMDAQDIANRLMRRENYMIAMINKDILDTTIPIPLIGKTQFFTRTIEWNVSLCIYDFVFDEHGRIKPAFLSTRQRHYLVAALRRRLVVAGLFNIVFAPFLVIYFCTTYFFRYFIDFQKNPAKLGQRQFTPLAEWKFREFNELWHLFDRRKRMAVPMAGDYLDQFPKDKMGQLFNLTAFVTGAIAAVLGLCTLLDPKLFLDFELWEGHTALFWLGLTTSIYVFARSSVPEEDVVLDPEWSLRNVIQFTRYCPASWEGRFHSDEVRREFSQLFKLKIVIFLEEALSMIVTPYVLLFSLQNSVEQIVDFFKDFTVHVDGLGHICSFAEFNFSRPGGNNLQRTDQGPLNDPDLRDNYFSTNHDKLLHSYYQFHQEYQGIPGRGLNSRTQTRRAFHPPPAFPGIAVQEHQPHHGQPEGGHPGMRQSTAVLRQSVHRGTPRFGPSSAAAGAHDSTMHSILLDAHHQPSIAGLRGSPRHAPQQGRHRSSAARAHPLPDAREADEEEGGVVSRMRTRPAGPVRTSSKVMAEDSELGDSWRTGKEDEDEDEEVAPGQAGGEGMAEKGAGAGAGVLGLLAQFQRVQAERGGVGL